MMDIKRIKELIHKINEPEYIYTPLELCEQMINSISDFSGNILVIRNIEFIYVLKCKGIDMSKVYYATNCKIKEKAAINFGILLNKIIIIKYNKIEVNVETNNMKFDVIIQNPPYNPNSLWKKFVEKGLSLLKDTGKMVAIHPENWRGSLGSRYESLFNKLKLGIEQLHIRKNQDFPNIGISVDWYLYNNSGSENMEIHRPNTEIEILKNVETNKILEFRNDSIPNNIIKKLIGNKHNGYLTIGIRGNLYDNHILKGKYKQCGGRRNNTGWTTGNFQLTDEPSKYQFENKIVMSYVRKPRAKYFSKEEQIGVINAVMWLTDNINSDPDSICLLLNSDLVWKMFLALNSYDMRQKHFPAWFLYGLDFDGLNAKNVEELYVHYKLIEEEINWINENN